MVNSEKTYLYEIKLSAKLMEQVEYFANQWNEELDLCVQRTLKSGLIARKETKERVRDELLLVREEANK
ncbi:MAG: hypothetical protein HY094_09925 [Candidatus Melainabacteria bacterium]|nr:hypothetical protein [Candidatus Melainabacteria bacterium]